MRFRFGRHIAFQHPDRERVADFYREILGGGERREDSDVLEIRSGQNQLFFDEGEHLGPIIELLVDDVDRARDFLLTRGCQVVRWEGSGGCCYLRDPFGFIFNLFPDPAKPGSLP